MAIDIHTHVVPANFPKSIRGAVAGWPSMEATHECHRNIMIDGKVYRTLSDRCWDTAGRLADMDQTGISLQAISPMPELFSYWMAAAAANDLLHFINDQIAEFVAQSRGRMVGLGAIPLQDRDLAIAELRRVRLELGFAGVEVGSNIRGTPIGAPEFDWFFAEAEELDAAVFAHAVRPIGMDRLVGPKALQQVLAYPTDVGLAAASVICSNVILRFPRLRIAFSHGGGTLATLLPRLERGREVFEPLGQTICEPAMTQARRFYYDSLVFSEPTLAHLVGLFDDTQLMVGTDYPFPFREHQPVERIRGAFADAQTQTKLLSENARRFLNLAEVRS